MGWMRGYQFKNINQSINNYLNLSKEIRIISFRYNHDKDISNNLHIGVYEDKNIIEDFYIDPRNIIINSKSLTKEDIIKLKRYIELTGEDYLDYQLYKIDHKELNNRLSLKIGE